jgi:hypothetical protein
MVVSPLVARGAWLFFPASLCTGIASIKVTPLSPQAHLPLQKVYFPENGVVYTGNHAFPADKSGRIHKGVFAEA